MEEIQEEQSLEKWTPVLDNPEALKDALEKAVDYRGDITLMLKNDTQIVGYLFNYNRTAAEPFVDLWPADQATKMKVKVSEISGLFFSGADTAAGKSWAAWVLRHKKAEAGTNADRA